MAPNVVTPSVFIIIKFLAQEKVKRAEILHGLNALCGVEILSCANVFNWLSKFSEGHEEVLDLLHAHVQPIAVSDVNICHDEKLILRTGNYSASNRSIRNGSVKTSIREHLLLQKVNGWWVPKTLMIDQKAQHVAVSTKICTDLNWREIHF